VEVIGLRDLEAVTFFDILLTDGSEIVSLTRRQAIYPPEELTVLISVRGSAITWLELLAKLKHAMMSSGIEPTTIMLVA
jgi:hypothetical protein